MAEVVVKFVGSSRQLFGPKVEVSVDENANIEQVIIELVNRNYDKVKTKNKKKEDIIKYLLGSRILVNDSYANLTYRVKDKDVITLITMAGGG